MTLWAGRFSGRPADALWSYTVDHTDRRLLRFDIQGSIAHAAMLESVGLLTAADHAVIDAGLHRLLDDALAGAFSFDDADEDVHTAVERRLVEMVGEVGGRLHAGRSRNDQVATDLRLYLRDACAEQSERLAAFAMALVGQARRHADTIVPAYTHLQQAQAVPLGHHLLAHAWAVARDRSRFADLGRRLGESPLGAGAAAGSGLGIDPAFTARRLGFESVAPNSMDAVGARDLAAEFVWCCTQGMTGLSRLAEELVLWASEEFSWVSFPDALATGSSALPHKKNPDIAELARGRAAGAIGDLTAILALQKGLPLTYNRDLQEDKVHVFRADDTLGATLTALGALVVGAVFSPPPPGPWVTSLDLAEALVRRGVPFRSAHAAVGRLVSLLVTDGRTLADADAADLGEASDLFEPADVRALDTPKTLAERTTPGGAWPGSVTRQADALEGLLGDHGAD